MGKYQRYIQRLLLDTDFKVRVSAGLVPGFSFIHKFGYCDSIGTSMTPVCQSGAYQTPQTLTSLEILSGSAADTAAGAYAQQVYIEGIGTDYEVVSETVSLNGITPVALANQYYRIYRWYVSRTGNYANAGTFSQSGALTIRVPGPGATWSTITAVATTQGLGQSQIGCYTVPAGSTAFILSSDFTIDSNKAVDLYFFKRSKIDETSAPYTGVMRLQNQYTGLTGRGEFTHQTYEAYEEKTDIGYMGKVTSGTGKASVEFELLLVENKYLPN